jgi:hypothetical protein
LYQDGPVKLVAAPRASSTAKPSAQTPEPPPEAFSLNVARYIQALADPRRAGHRVTYIRGIAAFASQLPDLDREPAEQLARYVLSPKRADEQAALVDHIDTLTRWRNVRLALADELRETRLSQRQVEDVLSGVLGRQFRLDPKDYRDKAYRELLRAVTEQMSSTVARTEKSDRVFNEVSDVLRELYSLQSRLAGVPPQQYTMAVSPAQALRLLIGHGAEQRVVQGVSAPLLEQVPQQLQAISFAQRNDIQHTVLLQRLWARILAIDAAGKHPERVGDVEGIVSRLQQADEQAESILEQLRDGERAILALRRVCHPS